MTVKEFPLSLLQYEMWLIDRRNKTARENVYGAFRLTGPLNSRALSAALGAVVARHEPLRTRITDSPIPRQRVEELHPVLEMEEAGSLEEATRIADREARTRFELDHLPLWRMRLLRLADDDHVLIFVFHHIVLDGWSLHVFLQDLTAAYTQALSGGTPDLGKLETSYGDFCSVEHDTMTPDAIAERVAHWRTLLPLSFKPLELPLDYPRTESAGIRGEALAAAIDSAVTADVRSRARREKTTAFNVILAAVATRLAHEAAAEQVIIGVPVDNRTSRARQPVIGYFSNVLPFALTVRNSRDGLTSELIQQAKEVSAAALRHPDVPPELLMRRLYGGDGDVPYRFCLNVQNPSPMSYSFPDLCVSGIPVNNGTAQLDYYLFLSRQADSFQGGLVYDAEIIARERAAAFWREVREILGTAAT